MTNVEHGRYDNMANYVKMNEHDIHVGLHAAIGSNAHVKTATFSSQVTSPCGLLPMPVLNDEKNMRVSRISAAGWVASD